MAKTLETLHEIWAIKSKGGTWQVRKTTHVGLAKTIKQADILMKKGEWHAVAVGLEGVAPTVFSYVNCVECGKENRRSAKHKRLPKYSKVALPMDGNPLSEGESE